MRGAAIALTAALVSTPAAAQEMDHSQHNMAGHDMAGMDHSAPADPAAQAEVGNDAPPPVPSDHAASKFYPAERMDRAVADLSHEGRVNVGGVFIDQLEYRAVKGGDGYAWKAQAWYGGDIDRAALTTEGEGAFGESPERAEVSALWRHTVGPWFNLEAGVRHDFNPGPQRTYAVLGLEGLAPYWIEVEGQLLVSNKGEVHARLAASHDMRITQKLILQPDVEVNVAFQDVPALGIGGGIERIEAGARLRYQVTPELAPYLGVHWEGKLGGSARAARAAGERPSAVSAVAGVRFWF
ncbi:MAG: copper resistance protein B [Novosphingobium sp.]